MNCLTSTVRAPVSHGNIYHTLLGAAEVRNTSYKQDLDLLAACRACGRLADHE